MYNIDSSTRMRLPYAQTLNPACEHAAELKMKLKIQYNKVRRTGTSKLHLSLQTDLDRSNTTSCLDKQDGRF